VFNIEGDQRLVNGTANSAGLISAPAEQPRTYGLRVGRRF
jgi:iron complex outermembrane receptor protein